MKGDFTRFSHQPEAHYAGVLMQQGRVTLDADWNEQFEIDDHRWRVQTIDTIGRACAPEGNAGFGLSFTPDGTDLIIHPGRIYIDGILVELLEGTTVRVTGLEGATIFVADLAPDDQPFVPGQWVEVLSDETETAGGPARTVARIDSVDAETLAVTIAGDPSGHQGETNVRVRRVVTYLTQPFYPASAGPPFADSFDPSSWSGQTHLVYLDVWRRHVTAIEDPDIREVALGGPDTATRVQTVWALRILRDPDREGEPVDASELACHDPHPAWDALTTPPAGRLSAQAVAAPAEDDPCAVQPDAGYRGLENRLYRVEIHDPGPLETATFMWSRDNGSILSSIVSFPQVDEVEVHSLGKDKVLRFHADDRVEAFSEISELAGLAGTMASIVGAPDEADRTISLDTDVSLYDGHPIPRLRRWDHDGPEPVTSNNWIELEHGVQVRFSGGPFAVGDYWVIPARVATGDIEGFVEAPRRGITHHFARLALVTWGGPNGEGTILDCRSTFPPLCGLRSGGGDHCCTISVGAEGDVKSLQEAVDALAEVEGPARICILSGEHRITGPVAITRSDLTISGCGRTSRLVAVSGGALRFGRCRDVRIEDLWILAASEEPVVHASSVSWFEMIDCRLVNLGSGDVVDLEAPNSPAGRPTPGRFTPDSLFAAIADSSAAVGEQLLAQGMDLGPGLQVDDGQIVIVRDNTIVADPAGSFHVAGLWFEHNLAVGGGIHLREGSEYLAVRSNTIERGPSPGVRIGGRADRGDVHNERVGVANVIIAANRIGNMGREGISSDPQDPSEIDELWIADNEIRGCGVDGPSDRLAFGGGILLRNVTGLTIEHNLISGNGPPSSTPAAIALGFGIATVLVSGLRVHGNTVVNNGSRDPRLQTSLNVGVLGFGLTGFEPADESSLLGRPAAVITDNTITTPEGPGIVLAGVGPMMVNDNEAVSTYARPSLLDIGRAVLIVNLGAPADTGLASFAGAVVAWRLRHGRVQVDDNQISVQAVPTGLPPIDLGVDPFALDAADLMVGSSVAVRTLDDLSLAGNQVLSEIHLTEATRDRPLRASVWAAGATLRTTDNRLSEVIQAALLSYFGFGLAHIVTENITTHCIRAEGTIVREQDNLSINCRKTGAVNPGRFIMWEG